MTAAGMELVSTNPRSTPISGAEIKKLKDDDLGATEIAKRLGIGRASVYRALA